MHLNPIGTATPQISENDFASAPLTEIGGGRRKKKKKKRTQGSVPLDREGRLTGRTSPKAFKLDED